MKRYILIDGNNQAWRQLYTHQALSHKDKPTGMIYGFFQGLLSLRRLYNYPFVVIWDSKSERRIEESKEAVEKGIIPSVYKSSRRENLNEQDELMRVEFKDQFPVLKRGLVSTSCQQVCVSGFEADDVIATYARDKDAFFIIVSTDQDFYQLLSENVVIHNPRINELIDIGKFRKMYGVEPKQWVDVGALMGDSSDTIHGVPGIGEKTALKLIQKHVVYENVIKFCEQKLDRSVIEKKIVEHKKRIELAYSLKKMDDIVDIPCLEDKKKTDYRCLLIFLQQNGFQSLYDKARIL